ncbi:nitrilase [Haloarcula rubripromontorii]|uniref:Nitrilase n=1 Tax=Haloarcula rubripromontorii TaxID=1705562 RepID=A0A0N0BNH5_9EURY|nr:carbon-nitrogen hydrolase family protein [Haloarcula rubripromontorii]KOX92504.1 nitrilase [Haloarcula rubripromontorii]
MPSESLTLAAAQVEPVYHDMAGTLDKTCRYIEQAGRDGADVVVFPETYFPGYPYWRGSVSIPRWTDLMVDLQKNSLHADDEAIEILGETVAEADLTLVLGTNEISDRQGSETLYNSLFYFDSTGELVGRHRKLMPTHEERAIWGRGDPSSLATYETDVGRLGGLICYENHMTLSKAALTAMGEEIHAAVWPGFWEQHGHPGDKTRAETSDAVDTCDIYPAMREYAFETQSFVASCSAYMDDAVPDGFSEAELGFNVAAGGSMLINPAGIVKAGPLVGEEGLLTAEFRDDERRATKAYFDAMGHYTRWDAVSLSISDATLAPSQPREPGKNAVAGDGSLSAAQAQAVAEEYDVPIEVVEAVADELAD